MKIDLDRYTGERRAKLIISGRPYASGTLQTLVSAYRNALVHHAGALKGSGYADEDGERLAALGALSEARSAERPEIARERTDARKVARAEVKASKALRLDARSILDATLHAASDAVDEEALAPYRTILSQTRSAGADVPALSLQLVGLADAFDLPALKAKLKARGGADMAARLRAQARRLDEAHAGAQLRQGTPEHTATLDLIDGLIIEQLRSIRRVARRASTRAGDPTIADAFSLGALD